jgi:hypothetical protein
MYCKQCLYELRYVSEPRCPECGKAFDPADRSTFYILSIQKRLDKTGRIARRLARVLILLALAAIMAFIIMFYMAIGRGGQSGR